MDLFNNDDLFSSNELTEIKFNLPDADVVLYENLFSQDDSNRLFKSLSESIIWQQDQIKYYGKMLDLPRLTAWYGENDKAYTYSGIPMNPHPWNEDLLYIKRKIEEKAVVNFTSCLLNLYRTGKDSVSWHQDNEKELGQNPIIGSVTFGETRPFQLKHLDLETLEKVDIPLKHGSFLLMQGTTQHYWKHQIPKTTKEVKPRINLTFRIIK